MPVAVFSVVNFLNLAGGTACLGLAILVLSPRVRPLADTDRLARALLAAVILLVVAFKSAQFHLFELTEDSGQVVNLSWNIIHGHGLLCSPSGLQSYLAVHFSLVYGAVAPLLLVWKSGAAVAAVEGACTGSCPLAVYLIARRRLSPAWAVAAAILTLGHPFFQGLAQEPLDPANYALPATLWGFYLWETGHAWWAAVMGLLLLATKEEAPFTLLGVGLALAPRLRRLGAALALASACLWTVEVALMARARATESFSCTDSWQMFAALGGSPGGVLSTALFQPWRLAAALVLPPAKLLTLLKFLAYGAFLPLWSGSWLLAAAAPWAPHQLAVFDSSYHRLGGHYAAFVAGPFLLAMVFGLEALSARLSANARRRLAAVVLAAAGTGMVRMAGAFNAHLMPNAWRESVPRVVASMPPTARVWCDGFMLPHFAARERAKGLPEVLPDCFFETDLFLPDFVVYTRYWQALHADAAGRVLTFLSTRGFKPVSVDKDVVVLENPSPQGALVPVKIP